MKKYSLSIVLLAIITILSLYPSEEFPETEMAFADKWAHWLMYGTLTYVLLWDFGRDKKTRALAQDICLMLFSMIWGGLMELAQIHLTTTRSGEWMDVAANCFGAICGLLLFYAVRKARSRKA